MFKLIQIIVESSEGHVIFKKMGKVGSDTNHHVLWCTRNCNLPDIASMSIVLVASDRPKTRTKLEAYLSVLDLWIAGTYKLVAIFACKLYWLLHGSFQGQLLGHHFLHGWCAFLRLVICVVRGKFDIVVMFVCACSLPFQRVILCDTWFLPKSFKHGCFRAPINKPLNTPSLRKQYGSKHWKREASTRFLTSDSLDRASSHSCVKGIGHWNPPNDACFWHKLRICREHRHLINKTKPWSSRVQECKHLCNGQGNHTKKNNSSAHLLQLHHVWHIQAPAVTAGTRSAIGVAQSASCPQWTRNR